jgi:Uma2 family endonuclease
MASRATPAPDPGYRWADFLALHEDDRRELIDGDLREVDVPTLLHEWVVTFIVSTLFNWARTNGGLVLASGYRVRIDDRRGVMPDVQFFRRGHAGRAGERGLESGAPDLVVEVVSPTSGRYDRVVKLGWYAAIGAPEYWIVDPEEGAVTRLVLEGTRYVIAEALTDEATFTPDSFPGLTLALQELFTPPNE